MLFDQWFIEWFIEWLTQLLTHEGFLLSVAYLVAHQVVYPVAQWIIRCFCHLNEIVYRLIAACRHCISEQIEIEVSHSRSKNVLRRRIIEVIAVIVL